MHRPWYVENPVSNRVRSSRYVKGGLPKVRKCRRVWPVSKDGPCPCRKKTDYEEIGVVSGKMRRVHEFLIKKESNMKAKQSRGQKKCARIKECEDMERK